MSLAYRLLAVDVDGTLLDSGNRLPDANRLALYRAHEAGMIVCLCTGRSYTEARPVLDAIGLDLDVAICVFGSIVSDARTGATLHRMPIDRPTATRLLDFFAARGHPVLVLHDAAEAGTDYYLVARAGQRNLDAYDRWLRLAPTRTIRADAWPADAREPVRIGIIDDPEHVAATQRDLAAAFGPDEVKANSIYAPNYGLYVLECFAPKVSKWRGIECVAADRGIDPRRVVAIGDDVNDVEMIRHAGLGIAMGNAIAAVREAARMSTTTNNEAGVARAIERVLAGDVPAPRE